MDEAEVASRGEVSVAQVSPAGHVKRKRAENRRSAAEEVSHHIRLHDESRRQVRLQKDFRMDQKESMRRIRRNSRTLLQDLFYSGVVHSGGRDTPIPAQPRDAKMIQSIASLIRAKSKLLLLENPDTVEIYKLDESTPRSRKPGKGDVYLPAISTKAASLNSIRGTLSQSCPYLYDKRRGSFSSVASQRAGGRPQKQSNLKAQREAKKSNVTVTMTYLGQGRRDSGSGSAQDELKVLQQVNGGENICVFKGLVTTGGRFVIGLMIKN
ncbi:uncharacterized protein LOC125012019 [Mugil cephalus]|uniref:uncharacterized protein LOC125012019 n=1 Tax=Mugil cephalus TaxID=48193 RepID=UPI001FB7BE6A|nr:uncharacterized protein LOC125012019 [Mugil cephalus]